MQIDYKYLARVLSPQQLKQYLNTQTAKWHESPEDGEKLHEKLNLTWDQYVHWVNSPNEFIEGFYGN
jgi:hypothetical protein